MITAILDSCLWIWKKRRWELFLVLTILIFIFAYFNGGRDLAYKYKGVTLSKSPKRTPVKKKHERECQRILQNIYNRPFISVRPDFLKNPKTGRNLELDLWNKELNLALEYQGVQHRTYSPYFHRQYSDFLSQQDRDQYKKQKCKDLKLDLIEVPDTVKFDDLEDYIRAELVKLGRPLSSHNISAIKTFTEILSVPEPVDILQQEHQQNSTEGNTTQAA